MKSFVGATLAVVLLILFQGCDVLQAPEPSTAVSQEVALSSPDAIQAIRAGMYGRMHNWELSTLWMLGPAALADNTYFRQSQERFQSLNTSQPRAGLGTAAYNDAYNLINDANILISGIEEDVLSEAVANKLEAEGRFFRALALHHLVRIFGYDPDGQGGVVSPNSGPGQGFNLGVVVRTKPTLSVADAAPKARSTVQEVYDQIVTDLNQALSLLEGLPDDVKEKSPFYVSEAAVQGLLARVHLYQRNWAEADARAQSAIDLAASMFGSRLADPEELADIFDETTTNPEAIFTIDVNPVTESAGVNDALSAYTSLQYLAQLPTQDLISLYEPNDARLDAWYEPCYDEIEGAPAEGCTLINDPGFELHKYAAEQGASTFADDYIHLRIAEMVLIQAEARLHASGPAAAINRLNDFREQRNASTLNPGNFTFDSAYDAILDERRRELVAEGHRFFDLKRLGRDIQKVHGQEDVPFTFYGILDDFPSDQLQVNTELVQNPGYR